MTTSATVNGSVGLPKTIEGATERYMRNYETQYRGDPAEKRRLKSYADARIFRLKTKAPKFYEEKLPTLINQAASALLTYETNTSEGQKKFHETHAHFLRVLDELKKSQPAGDVDFQVELSRTKERDDLKKKQLKLRKRIDELDAMEFDADEIGEEDYDTHYAKAFAELERNKVELKRISTLIAKMEGESLEDDIKFKLKVVPRSSLEKLTAEQLNKLESLFDAFYTDNRRNKKAMYVDKSVIDGLIDQLDIDKSKFTQVELNHLSKDALDAYRTFFRDLDNERRNEFHESLINNQQLRPKEGLILESPNDVPEEIRQKLLQSEQLARRQLDDFCEEFAKRPCNEDVGYDEVNDEEGGASGEDEVENVYMEKHGWLFNRIKEEPRDDYADDAPSDDEMMVDENLANEIEEQSGQQRSSPNTEDEENRQATPLSPDTSNSDQSDKPAPETGDDFQLLGIVEPTDKIDLITIDDDD